VVGFIDDMKRSPGAEPLGDSCDERRLREFVFTPLQEQHRNLYLDQMVCSFGGWLARRVQREAEEN
jgi:hypothetical protein